MVEFLWLLLPVAAATGWWTGRQGARQSALARRYDAEYYRGLAYLLDEEEDKAIELFIRLVQVDQDTVETHLTLGNLFRKRGEVDRAIRIHQNLIARPNLPRQVRGDGQLELAQDYLAAGLLDRAEEVFNRLVDEKLHSAEAFEGLILIYEREKEWNAAIGASKRAYRNSGVSRRKTIAHYHCELALVALSGGDDKKARQQLKQALHFDRDCARASMMLGDMAMRSSKTAAAVKHYRAVEQQSPELFPEVVDKLLEAIQRANDEVALSAFCERARDSLHSFSVTRAMAGLLEQREGGAAAERFFKESLLKRPSLRALRHWAGMELRHRKPTDRDNIQVIVDMLDRVIATRPAYTCTNCGFKGQSLHWQCPGCHHWDTIRPIFGDEGD